MFISFKNVSSLFAISQDTVVTLREENAALKAELAATKSELVSAKVNLDWLRIQYNQAQFERTALMNQRYGLNVPAPELAPAQAVGGAYLPNAKAAKPDKLSSLLEALNFEDIGDEAAAAAGLPVYGA